MRALRVGAANYIRRKTWPVTWLRLSAASFACPPSIATGGGSCTA